MTDSNSELRIAVTSHEGEVVVYFSDAVTWFSVPPVHARKLADLILRKATFVEHNETPAPTDDTIRVRPGPLSGCPAPGQPSHTSTEDKPKG